jgi:hypothetical protein
MERREFLKRAALTAPAWAASGLVPPFLLPPPAPAQEDKGAAFQEVIPAQVEAIDRGLRWLASNQFSSGGIGTTCQVAFTGVAGLAFLASNSTPIRGPYAKNVRNCLKFIMRCSSKVSGYINEAAGRGLGGSGMHGHGYATWFLAELYGMCGDLVDLGDESVKERLTKAVQIIEQSQDPNGGWTYEPQPYGHEGSVTITQVQALRSARNSGIAVKKQVIEKGIDYIRKSTHSDGTIAYSLGSRGSGGTYALTAAGMCVFAMYGVYDSPEVKRGMAALMDFLKGQRGRGGHHDYYAHLYAGQACFFAKSRDPEFWTRGFTVIRSELLQSQDKSTGCWSQDGYGGAFGTACATLVLQIPYRYLPIFQD